jgi:5,10-methylenetetrahydromethanopterin reductase
MVERSKAIDMKLWQLVASFAQAARPQAERAEADGWHGIGVTDSQNLAGDAWIALAAMATATDRLELGTTVTNPITRHPAVTASAAQSLAALAGDRVFVGIGRGDSALAHLGRAPASVSHLERYVRAVRGYLAGEAVPFDALGFSESSAPDVATLGMADTPDASRLVFRRPADPRVPVEVAATGPRVIGAAARSADRVVFALGADPERLEWGMETARAARREAGLDPETLEFAAYVNLVAHPDLAAARAMVAGGLTTFARFAVMHGKVNGPTDAAQREVMERLHSAYDMQKHTRNDSDQAATLTPEFIDRYSIVGPADHCVQRLKALEAIGIGKVIVIGASAGSAREQVAVAHETIRDGVLSAFAN